MWINRNFSEEIRALAAQFPAIALTGARQTGKTSLLQRLFPGHTYVTLDVPSTAELADKDPETFLARHPPPLVVDEVQYAPRLFRHLKVFIDSDRHNMGRFILTGSQLFPLMKGVTESLAGRIGIIELENLSCHELRQHNYQFSTLQEQTRLLARGTFPELWRVPESDAFRFYESYLATYLERDVRQLVNVGQLRDFERCLRACAVRSGNLLNKADIARDVGVSPPTINAWISALQASGQIVLLEPFFWQYRQAAE